MLDFTKTKKENNKEYIVYVNTGFIVDCIICKDYFNLQEAINDLRIKFDNYLPNFITTKQHYLDFKKSIKKR